MHNLNEYKKSVNNIKQYDTYYNKPSLWFKLRYGTRRKDHACRFLIQSLSRSWHYKTIVELGFGHANIILSFPIDNNIIGAEISHSAIIGAEKRACRKGFKNYTFYSIEDYPNLRSKVNKADLVVASHVLEHVNDDQALVNEIYDLLNPGGSFVLLVPINEYKEDPNHVRRYTVNDCCVLHENIGFKCVKIFEFDYFFSIIERIYWGRGRCLAGLLNSILWKMFSAFFGFWPFKFYRFLDEIAVKYWNALPRQVGFVFTK